MRAVILMLMVFLAFGCNRSGRNSQQSGNSADLKETLIEANKKVLLSEDQQIDDLINRYGWKMEKTGTGLRYLIYKRGKGQEAKKGLNATLNYSVRLITGDEIYSSEHQGPKQFTIGSGGVESGLEEAILLLHEGDKAKLVIPSHLAYGLLGDQDRIPPKATLIYDLELLKLNNY
jgi:FKBP-type peptidyl-prolyl cis-trans isomerase FkpA